MEKKMTDNQKKASLFCVLAFLLGCLAASVGCSVDSATRIKTGFGEIGTTLEAGFCSDCGFAPWTDSWCEHHHGT
tara:strand:+ start:1355 stop:1579 length:225 start_codon:yes stop_codon:yes gene_type:complete